MRRLLIWTVVLLALVGVTGFILFRSGLISPNTNTLTAASSQQDGGAPVLLEGADIFGTVPIMPADALMGKLSASGTIELVEKTKILSLVEGIVSRVEVKVGDQVAFDALLVALDTTTLERNLVRAEIDFDVARLSFAKAGSKDIASEIAAAEAELRSAQEEMAKVSAGPTAEEIRAAESNAAGAWATYNDLLDGPTVAQINEAQATLKKAEVDLAEAQSAYNEIKWLPESSGTGTARELQRKTIDFEAAQASFDQVNRPSSTADLQQALSTAQSAQDELNKLLVRPTVAELATAEATVRQAEKTLTELQAGSSQVDIQTAELDVKKALIDLAEAQTNLANAQIKASTAGTVISLDVEEGQSISSAETVLTIADLSQLKVVINVAEADVYKISLGQRAEIQLDALRGSSFDGSIAQINPVGESTDGVITYPVTVELDVTDLTDVRPNMSATVILANEELPANSWLVPQNSIQEVDGNSTVTVVREETESIIEVATGELQGEWILVQSAELNEGDEVVGSVASFVDSQAAEMFR
ncbi:MAG: efflux RND transporter periplasmic adaptor subunit [Chloroflexota bacterium]